MLIESSFLLLAATFIVARCFEVHHHMTEDEIKSVFHTNDLSNLPDYELVPVHYSLMNGTHAHIRIQAQNVEQNLKLEAVDSILFGASTKVWAAGYDTMNGEVFYTLIENALERAVAYQDRSKRAALMMFTDEHNNAYYDGTIGSQYVISHLPLRTLHDISQNDDYRNHKNATCQSFHNCTLHHVMFKRNTPNEYQDNIDNRIYFEDELEVSNEELSQDSNEGNAKTNQQPETSKTFYPKILVVVDSRLHNLIGCNVVKTLKYIMSFMNGVDMHFKRLDDPRVELHVAGVIIAQTQKAIPFEQVLDTPTDYEGLPLVNASSALNGISKYFEKTNFEKQISESILGCFIKTKGVLIHSTHSGECTSCLN